MSAQAQALLIAEQPEQARELLQALAKNGPLAASDRLHLGLALLAGKGSGRDALEHVQAAAQTLGGHPRVLAALALALHRADETSEALMMLQRAQDALGADPDPFDEALVQRGVKLLRTVQKAQQKRERKVEPAARVAGAAMKTSTPADRLPWQRVVGKRGGLGVIAIHDPVGAAVQRALLTDEGVAISDRGTIALARFGWLPLARRPRARRR